MLAAERTALDDLALRSGGCVAHAVLTFGKVLPRFGGAGRATDVTPDVDARRGVVLSTSGLEDDVELASEARSNLTDFALRRGNGGCLAPPPRTSGILLPRWGGAGRAAGVECRPESAAIVFRARRVFVFQNHFGVSETHTTTTTTTLSGTAGDEQRHSSRPIAASHDPP